MLKCIECNFTHYFYPNISYPYHLEECKEIKFNNSLIYSPFNHPIYCKIKENELSYFKNYNDNLTNEELAYNHKDDDQRMKTNFAVVKLDVIKHPILRVDYFFIPDEVSFNINSRFSLIVSQDVEIEVDKNKISFNIIIGLESEERNDSCILSCKNDISSGMKVHLIVCHLTEETFKVFDISKITYNDGYLYPYIIPLDDSYPFEIIIPGIIRADRDYQIPKDDPDKFLECNYLKIYYPLIVLIILLLI